MIFPSGLESDRIGFVVRCAQVNDESPINSKVVIQLTRSEQRALFEDLNESCSTAHDISARVQVLLCDCVEFVPRRREYSPSSWSVRIAFCWDKSTGEI